MSNYLLLGGNGFIGKNLINEIVKNDSRARIRVFDRVNNNHLSGLDNIEYLTGNFNEINNFDTILKDIDVVYHLISVSVPNEDTSLALNDLEYTIMPTIKLFEALKKFQKIKLIFVSSGGTVYGEPLNRSMIYEDSALNPISTYGVHKVAIEKYLHVYNSINNLDYIIIRLGNPYGYDTVNKGQGIIPIFLNKMFNDEELSILGDGNNVRDYIYIEDAVSAIFKLKDYVGNYRIFNVGSGIGYSINEIIEKLSDITGITNYKIRYSKKRKSDIDYNVLDISRITTNIDWEPDTKIDDGIRKILTQLSN